MAKTSIATQRGIGDGGNHCAAVWDSGSATGHAHGFAKFDLKKARVVWEAQKSGAGLWKKFVFHAGK